MAALLVMEGMKGCGLRFVREVPKLNLKRLNMLDVWGSCGVCCGRSVPNNKREEGAIERLKGCTFPHVIFQHSHILQMHVAKKRDTSISR